MRRRLRQAFSPARLAGDAIEVLTLLLEAPRKTVGHPLAGLGEQASGPGPD